LKYSTGVPDLDNLFGGYKTKSLYLFYGENGTGKTTLGAYVPILTISKYLIENQSFSESDKFIIVDCDGSFDDDRMEQILINNGLKPEAIFPHIIRFEPTTFKEQHKTVKSLSSKIKKEKWNPLLITVDAMSAIYRGLILRTEMKFRLTKIGFYTGKLDLQLTIMRHLAVKYDCPAIAVSWPISKAGEQLKDIIPPEQPFIGGRQFGFFPKYIIELKMFTDESNPLRIARLYKAKGLPSGRTAMFKLSDKGIESAKES